MFSGASAFNQPLDSWNTSNVTDMSAMFSGTSVFNQPLDSWNTSNVTDMSAMFSGTSVFNQPLDSWNTSNITDMSDMFHNTLAFNQPLNNWNTSNVTDMSDMFHNALAFDQPLNNWNTSNVTDMSAMFMGSYFDQPLNNWDTSNVTNMSFMFSNSYFNQPLDNWDTSNVSDMRYMFFSSHFNQDISAWNVAKVTSDRNFDEVTSLSWTAEMKPHFSKAVIEWSKTLPMTLAPGETEVEHPSYVISDPGLTDRLMANKTYTYRIKNIGERPLTFDAKAVDTTSSDITISNNSCINTSLTKGATCSFDIMASSQTSASIILQLTTADADIANPEDKILSDVKIIPSTVICSEVRVGEIFTLDGDSAYYLVVEDGTDTSGIKNGNTYDNYINSDMNKVCTTHVTDMSDLFHGSTFNRNIDDWDTSNVTTMSTMFSGAAAFDQPLNSWDTGKVTDMSAMFSGASTFNQLIDNWNTHNVTDMSDMFHNALAFNQPLNSWNTSNVTDMSAMFSGASAFNQPLDNWDTSNVTDMSEMFSDDSAFTQNISAWNVAKVSSDLNFDRDTSSSWTAEMKPHFSKAVIEWSKSLPIMLGAQREVKVLNPEYVISNPEVTDRLMANKTYTYIIKNTGEMQLTFNESAIAVTGSDIIISNNYCNNASLAKDVTCSFDITTSSQTSASIGLQLTTADADITNPEDKALSVKIIPGTVICGEVPVGKTFTLDGDPAYYLVVEDGIGPSGIRNDNTYDNYIQSDMNKVCTTHVTDMSYLFFSGLIRDLNYKPLNNLNTMLMPNTTYRFVSNSYFDQPLDNWDTSNVTNMSHMFFKSRFNQPLDNWDTSSVTNMSFMFFNSYFDQPLNRWDTSNVTDMSAMFMRSYFDQPLNNWDTSNVSDMNHMFVSSYFNQPLNNWNTSNVNDMSDMFHNSYFNQDISAWDVANVTEYQRFDSATSSSWTAEMKPKFRQA